MKNIGNGSAVAGRRQAGAGQKRPVALLTLPSAGLSCAADYLY
jgi:hypothetical protein